MDRAVGDDMGISFGAAWATAGDILSHTPLFIALYSPIKFTAGEPGPEPTVPCRLSFLSFPPTLPPP